MIFFLFNLECAFGFSGIMEIGLSADLLEFISAEVCDKCAEQSLLHRGTNLNAANGHDKKTIFQRFSNLSIFGLSSLLYNFVVY